MTTDIEKTSTDLVIQAKAILVIDQESANMATRFVLAGKDAIKQIKAFFAPMKESAWAAHQEVVQKEKSALAKIEPTVNAVMRNVADWRAEEDRKRLEVEAGAYRTEQLRIMAEAEAKRKADEMLWAAERAEAEGDQEKADKLIEKAAKIEEKSASTIPSPAPVIPPKPITEGLSMRDNWCFEVVDPMAVPRKYLTIDMVTIGKVVRVLKDQASIPGIRVFNHPSMAEIGHRKAE